MIEYKKLYPTYIVDTINSLHAGYFFMLLILSADFFSNLTFSKYSLRNTIRVSNGLDLDQNIGPYLDPNCLQRLSAEDKSRR